MPGALPTKATSGYIRQSLGGRKSVRCHEPARYGRAQPFGHPVIRMTIESLRSPFSSQIFSTLSIRMGRY